ncbi:MAG TPA: hypothetical protein VGI10_28625 [Polyangiaceae bacterium]|jgi:hypothetical protein
MRWRSSGVLGAALLALCHCSGKSIDEPRAGESGGNAGAAGQALGGAGRGTVGGSTGAGFGGFYVEDGGAFSTCPNSCAALHADCGYVNDPMCGVIVDCNDVACPIGEYCGGDGPSRCGSGAFVDGGSAGAAGAPEGGAAGAPDDTCRPTTCSELNAECGVLADPNCPGSTVSCGECVMPYICVGPPFGCVPRPN